MLSGLGEASRHEGVPPAPERPRHRMGAGPAGHEAHRARDETRRRERQGRLKDRISLASQGRVEPLHQHPILRDRSRLGERPAVVPRGAARGRRRSACRCRALGPADPDCRSGGQSPGRGSATAPAPRYRTGPRCAAIPRPHRRAVGDIAAHIRAAARRRPRPGGRSPVQNDAPACSTSALTIADRDQCGGRVPVARPRRRADAWLKSGGFGGEQAFALEICPERGRHVGSHIRDIGRDLGGRLGPEQEGDGGRMCGRKAKRGLPQRHAVLPTQRLDPADPLQDVGRRRRVIIFCARHRTAGQDAGVEDAGQHDADAALHRGRKEAVERRLLQERIAPGQRERDRNRLPG